MLKLKCCLLNTENLFLVFNKDSIDPSLNYDKDQWFSLQSESYNNKPLKKTQHLAKTLLEAAPDIMLLTEIGGLESLKNFNKYFLNNTYSPILIEGNSDRHIDVGFLIKKESLFYFDLFSHKNFELNLSYEHTPASTKLYFSRDCAELRLFDSDVEKPFLIFLLTHLKSPLDPENIDMNGAKRRKAELDACIEIYNKTKEKHPHTPIILCGDFNGNAAATATEPEFENLYSQTDLQDIFELSEVEQSLRTTFVQFKNGTRPDLKQIDYVFLSSRFANILNKSHTKVLPYKDEFGFDLSFPQSLDQKMQLPSDHYPITFMLEISRKD